MNKKALTLILLLCGLILSALLTRNGEFLLLGIPLIVYILLGLLRAPVELALIAKRTLNFAIVNAHENVEARIRIENQGKQLVSAWCNDLIFAGLEMVEGRKRSKLFLSPGERAEIVYEFKAGRGRYAWKTIQIWASDPFGLFDLLADIPAQGNLHVFPEPMAVRAVDLRAGNTIQAAGPKLARSAGSGTDFWGVREYRLGDSLRRLNWRLSARYPNRLFTNEFESEEIADYGLILDSRRLNNSDELDDKIFENSVSAAASLAGDFLKKGNRVSMLIFGKPISHVFPGYGKQQLYSILKKLASVNLGPYVPFDYIKYFPVRLFPPRSMIIVFSSVNSRDVDVYDRLRSFGYDVLLISPDPVDLVLSRKNPAAINHLAARTARVERAIILNELAAKGVKVIDWQIDQPLDKALQGFFEGSARWWN